MVNTRAVTSVKAVEQAESGGRSSGMKYTPLAAVQASEQQALMVAQAASNMIGEGVTDEGQAVFYALAKTLPCFWSGKNIVALDITIRPPYSAADCSGDEPTTLARVQRVLEGERKKIKAKMAEEAASRS